MRTVLSALALAAALSGAAAAEAATSAPSPRAQALAHEIYTALGGPAQMSAMQDRMLAPMLASMPAPAPGGKDLRADLAAFVRAEVAKFTPQITAASERIYAETFTEAQLADILAFYRSPAGHAMAEKLPEIGARTGQVLAPVIKQMQADMMNHLCDLTGCTPAQRAQVAKLAGG